MDITTRPRTRPDPIAHMQLWAELEALGQLVERAYPEGHPMREVFKGISYDVPEGEEPTLSHLTQARNAFDNLPTKEKRRVLNGWRPYRQRRGGELEEYKLPVHSNVYHRVLQLDMMLEGEAAGEVIAFHRLEEDQGMIPLLSLQIREGATQAQAIQAAAELLTSLHSRWDELIAPRTRLHVPLRHGTDRVGAMQLIDLLGDIRRDRAFVEDFAGGGSPLPVSTKRPPEARDVAALGGSDDVEGRSPAAA